mmetsp:Transcript_8509/g.22720  ORF Transcript_8509/g.22720 Transcript_8509/m.22720 type:complete len:207 (+) Transcript_8509:209-829(+)
MFTSSSASLQTSCCPLYSRAAPTRTSRWPRFSDCAGRSCEACGFSTGAQRTARTQSPASGILTVRRRSSQRSTAPGASTTLAGRSCFGRSSVTRRLSSATRFASSGNTTPASCGRVASLQRSCLPRLGSRGLPRDRQWALSLRPMPTSTTYWGFRFTTSRQRGRTSWRRIFGRRRNPSQLWSRPLKIACGLMISTSFARRTRRSTA